MRTLHVVTAAIVATLSTAPVVFAGAAKRVVLADGVPVSYGAILGPVAVPNARFMAVLAKGENTDSWGGYSTAGPHVTCSYTLEPTTDVASVPSTFGFSGGLSRGTGFQPDGTQPFPVLGPYLVCVLTCSSSPPPAGFDSCTGTVTIEGVLSK